MIGALSSNDMSGQKSCPFRHCTLPENGLTELNVAVSFNS